VRTGNTIWSAGPIYSRAVTEASTTDSGTSTLEVDDSARKPERPGRSFVIHPFFFAAFPVLFLFQQNIREVNTRDIYVPLLIAIGFSIVLFGLGLLFLRNLRKAAFAASLVVALTFSYGHIADVIENWRVAGVLIGRDLYLIPVLSLVTLIGIVAVARAKRSFADATKILNTVAVVMVALSLGGIILYKIQHHPISVGAGAKPTATANGVAKGPARDIYYIILEDYGSEATLKRWYAFDDSPFTKALQQRGFYVAANATTNYPNTAHALAASLNLEYVNFLQKKVGPVSSEWAPVYSMLQTHKVGEFLKDHGYTYIHLGSRWAPMGSSKIADINVKSDKLTEFTRLVLDTTILEPISEHLGFAKGTLDTRHVYYNQTLAQFENIARTRDKTGRKFVLAHIMLPHRPVIFDRAGKYVTAEQEKRMGRRAGFLEQVRFSNLKVLELLDRLQSGPEDKRPIIILQTDEGPSPLPDPHNTSKADAGSWITKTSNQLKQKFGILNAFYLPGVKDPGLYPDISSVNTFRKVFDLYFGTDLPLLPDRDYIWRDLKHLYDFVDVTKRVKG
jgi:hypothetical protein